MKFSRLVLAAALAIGLGGAASATPLPTAADMIRPDTAVTFVKSKGHKGWGHRGRHYGWYRGHHRGWYKPHRRVYYVAPRRHYGWHRGRHYGWYPHRRPRHVVYFRF